ncbi:MAG: 4-hydroxy-tetrahydrodipicolinate synthase [Bacteroidota bacterium]
MEQFLGTGVALVTPFDIDDQIDYTALEQLVNFQIDNSISYLVALGTTAETPTLSKHEQEQVVKKIIEVNNKRLPIVLGIGGNHTAAVINNIKRVDVQNIDAILSVSPYYNKPTQEGIYQHYKAIAEVSQLPIILYNVPHRTGTNMEPGTVMRLANDFDNIVGIKEAAGDYEQILELLKNKPKDFMVISGEDKLALPLVLAGGTGVISVIAQGLPNDFSKIIKLGLENRSKEAFELFYKLMPSIDLIFSEGNPAGIKSMLNQLKICDPYVRLPLIKASNELQQKISNFVSNFK